MTEILILKSLVGAMGLVAAALSLWYLDENYKDFDKKLSIKISAATVVFSLMMFTPVIGTEGGFIDLGVVYFPSLKVVADAVILGFLTSSLKDIIENERSED